MIRTMRIGILPTCAILSVFVGCISMGKKDTLRKIDVKNPVYEPHADMSGVNILSFCREHLKEAASLKEQLKKSKGNKDFLKTLDLYNNLLIHIDRSLNQAGLMSQVHPDEKIRKDAESCEQEISSFITDFSLDKEIYEILAAGEKLKLKPDEERLLSRTLRDFRRAGVDKDDKTRTRIKELKEDLVKIGQEFDQNIRDERLVIKLKSAADLDGLPEDYIKAHPKGPDGMISISTDYPDYFPFMTYAKNNELREELHFKFLNRGQKNDSVLRSMLEKRHELATMLLNYKSFADYIVEDKMIKNAKNIHEFIDKISMIAQSGADREYAALLEFKKRSDPKATSVNAYESSFLEEGLKKSLYNFDSKELRPYFSYENVLQGLLKTTANLFGIRYELIPNASVWHPSVVTYDVFDEQGKLGRIFLDMHPRKGKFQHAAQFSVVSGLSQRQYPEGALVCNFPNPKEGDGSALMEHKDVVTFFHEFGHLLHHVLGGMDQRWITFSGVATEWDFVETPSQLLEEWARSPEVLPTFAHHYQSKEPIPSELIKKMLAASEFGKALFARQQSFYAALSANYFDRDPHTFDPLALLKDLQAQYSYFPYREGTHFNRNFGHLNGYSAMYYTYMWSLSIAKDLLDHFQRNGLMNSKEATRYKDLILKKGGSQDAAEMVQEFLGRPFKFDAFEAWLRSDPMSLAEKQAKN